MPGEILYLDASALVKLVNVEPESGALAAEITRWNAYATSVLGAVELRRVVRRVSGDAPRADAVLEEVSLVELDEGIRELAARLDPPELRTLDSLHLASAVSLEDDVGGFACYDERLANAAADEGLLVIAPR